MVEKKGGLAKQNEEGKPITSVASISSAMNNKNVTFMISNPALSLAFFLMKNIRSFYLTRKS